ncbi:hypothetical protein Desaci_3736 [Desulfosporosinus acidiphilus SJ4]|uniref:Uncharacterized protein n=1 Tax=Desulfosporosinus acidiphilus (strain DSM 22704 / JCM 16185 / SJ4) TaxID=646529 RepID=I4D9Z3_DESAJ|nr:hypothetical protein [Desulfosporosinus acidiphilus]AFM42617.1 hypothetical protein Desaci_3736 [Desulfosporosinus acidiphilus SJ4]
MNRLISEISSDVLIQGFGLHEDERKVFIGKVGGQEIQLLPDFHNLDLDAKELKILFLGLAEASHQFRPGDVLMTGSDDLLDRAFQVMDDIEQRCIVVTLSPDQDSTHLYFSNETLEPLVQEWKQRKVSFLCLWMVAPQELEGQAKLVTILRKIILKDS